MSANTKAARELLAKLDYVVPEFGSLWEPHITYLPNGWGVAVAQIGPELAAAMLEMNHSKNRNKRLSVTPRYVSDMAAGLWRLTHQGVAFDRNGELFDGQHRLTACVQAKSPFDTLVFFGVGGVKEMAVTDTGAPKSAADVSAYIFGKRIDHDVIAVVRAMLYGTARSRPTFTHSHILSQIGKHRAAVVFYHWAFRWGDHRGIPACARAAVCRAFYHADPDDLARFVSITGERVNPSEPRDAACKQLRHYVQEGTRGGMDRRRDEYMKGQRAVRAYLDGQTLHRLYASEDDLFPLPTDAQLDARNRWADEIQQAAATPGGADAAVA